MRTSVIAGDETRLPSEFEELYRSQRSKVIELAWLLTHDAGAAEDIAHDAFARLFVAFPDVEHPAAYPRRSVVNGVYDPALDIFRSDGTRGEIGAGVGGETAAVDRMLDTVRDAIRMGSPLAYSIDDAVISLAAVEATYRSIERGQPVSIPSLGD